MNEITFSRLGDMGRLGNQLFQIATTYVEGIKSNRKIVIPEWWQYRSRFGIPDEYYGQPKPSPFFVHQRNMYTPIPPQGDIDLFGWFQSIGYIEGYRDELIDLIIPNREINPNDYCAIHIRRTDYLENPACHKTPMSYYNSVLDGYDGKVMVFSDDIRWCKDNLSSEYEFSNQDVVSDLFLMRNCKKIVMANSSLSWMASFLSGHNNIHMPKFWLNRRQTVDTELVYNGWVVEEYEDSILDTETGGDW